MPSEEEKRTEEEEKTAATQAPGDGEEEVEEADEEEAATEAEKKERHFWPYALALMLLVMAAGGYYTLTGLNSTAQKLGGGSDYDRLAANSEEYDGTAGQSARGGVYFHSEEAPAPAREIGSPRQDRLNAAVVRPKGQLAAEAASGGLAASGGAPNIPQGSYRAEEEEAAAATAGAGASPQGAMASKLQARAGFGRQAMNRPGAAAGSSVAAFEGAASLGGRASYQRETSAARPKQAGKGGVMDSLKGAFRATFYGARVSSQDSAREWISRTFDAAPQAESAIEYDEKMRAGLDRVNPNSIPSFLRDQDVDAAEAKRLADSKVSDPKLDKEGTYEALQKDKAYQQQKLASDFGSSMINSMFAGISGTGQEQTPGVFSDPEDQSTLDGLALGEYLESTGNGEECGCSAAAPCCCLPQDYFQNQQQPGCPAYGPFLPDDPCGAAIYGGVAGEGVPLAQ